MIYSFKENGKLVITETLLIHDLWLGYSSSILAVIGADLRILPLSNSVCELFTHMATEIPTNHMLIVSTYCKETTE